MNEQEYQLPHAVRAWVQSYTGTLKGSRRLKGSTSTTLVWLQNHQDESFVLRLYDNEQWLSDEPDLALHEAAALTAAGPINIPTPDLIAVDNAEKCLLPVTLMTYLPGEVILKPADMSHWLQEIATKLAMIHQASVVNFDWKFFPYMRQDELQVPNWTAYPRLWQKAINILRGPEPEHTPCLIHRDFHPVNLLWKGETISGVVDWVNACTGATSYDVAYCRVNLVQMYGQEIADDFLTAYLRHEGTWYHPYFDLRALADMLDGTKAAPGIYPPWATFGLSELSESLILARLETYLVDLLSQF